MGRDIHVAAAAIDDRVVKEIEKIGFVEDHFSNCRHCDATSYHATYRGTDPLLDGKIWQQTKAIVGASANFKGILELEECLERSDWHFDAFRSHAALPDARALQTQPCPVGIHKQCDVHIRTYLNQTSEQVQDWLDRLQIASFERDRDEVPTRVYTATFDTLAAGQKFMRVLDAKLGNVAGSTVIVKLEKILDFLRLPDNATTLPITFQDQLVDWISLEAA